MSFILEPQLSWPGTKRLTDRYWSVARAAVDHLRNMVEQESHKYECDWNV